LIGLFYQKKTSNATLLALSANFFGRLAAVCRKDKKMMTKFGYKRLFFLQKGMYFVIIILLKEIF